MHRRPRFRRRAPLTRGQILILTLMLFIAIIILSLWLIDQRIRPVLMDIAELKTIEFATRTINTAVRTTENMNFDDLVYIEYDNNGNVSTLGWNSEAVNWALRTATERAEYYLYSLNREDELQIDDPDFDHLEFDDTVEDIAAKDPTVVEIPLGQATGNALLANLGPRIPVHFEIVGSLQSDVMHEIKEFGVNAALVEIYIPITVNMQIIIPFSTSTREVSTRVFIDSRVIMGDVPDFYNTGGGQIGASVPMQRKTDDSNN